MFRRLLLDNSTTLFTFVAFLSSASIFVSFLWRALRMKSQQVDHFSNLPLQTEKPAARHDA
jgi:hypothetical protein